ncbi:MAG: hypothetical protein OCC45_13280 [Desulfotalea sp.]
MKDLIKVITFLIFVWFTFYFLSFVPFDLDDFKWWYIPHIITSAVLFLFSLGLFFILVEEVFFKIFTERYVEAEIFNELQAKYNAKCEELSD